MTHASLQNSELSDLNGLDLAALRAKWLQLTGKPAPTSFRRDLLLQALAYEIQVRRSKGLSAPTKRRLRVLAEAARNNRFDEALGETSLKTGTVLLREWQGQTHRVTVQGNGFLWKEEIHGSLSTIAKAITGTSWNGWTFFGVRKPVSRNKNAQLEKGLGDGA
jgi:Protein of unknown function (DUF2924)